MLESVPRLNPAVRWDDLESGQMMAAYKKAGNGLVRAFRMLFTVPDTAQLLLDEIGAKVVRRIDGVRTVQDLIGYVAQEFKLNRREAEVSLLKYMDLLGRRNLIGFEVRPAAKRGNDDS